MHFALWNHLRLCQTQATIFSQIEVDIVNSFFPTHQCFFYHFGHSGTPAASVTIDSWVVSLFPSLPFLFTVHPGLFALACSCSFWRFLLPAPHIKNWRMFLTSDVSWPSRLHLKILQNGWVPTFSMNLNSDLPNLATDSCICRLRIIIFPQKSLCLSKDPLILPNSTSKFGLAEIRKIRMTQNKPHAKETQSQKSCPVPPSLPAQWNTLQLLGNLCR